MKKYILLITLVFIGVNLFAQETDICKTCSQDGLYVMTQERPEYEGSIKKFFKDLNKELDLSKKITAKVFVSFIVSKEDNACCFEYLQNSDKRLEENDRKEVMRALKSLQKWQAGKARGNKVNSQVTLPLKIVDGKIVVK